MEIVPNSRVTTHAYKRQRPTTRCYRIIEANNAFLTLGDAIEVEG